MSVDLTRCCCGPGCGCGGCGGNFFPDTLTVTFTPQHYGAWSGGFFSAPGVLCPATPTSPPDPPAGGVTWPKIGDYGDWYAASPVTLTFTRDPLSPSVICYQLYKSDSVTCSPPSNLPGWEDNPLDLDADSAKWCQIETNMDCFGYPNYFGSWNASLILEATQCKYPSQRGEETNTLEAELTIRVANWGYTTGKIVLRRKFVISTATEECGCLRGNFGGGDWLSWCPYEDPDLGDCFGVPVSVAWGGTKIDWSSFGLGTTTQTWTTDPSIDCCEDLTVVQYYIGGDDVDVSASCPDHYDFRQVDQLDTGLNPPADPPPAGPTNQGTIHYAEKRDSAEGLDPCSSWCTIISYGFALSTMPAFTDLSLDAP